MINKIQFKIVLISLLLLAISIGGTYIYARTSLQKSFQAIEDHEAKQNINRGVDTIKANITTIDQKASDWAVWDDAYRYVQGQNKDFEAINFGPDTLANLGIDYLAYYNAQKVYIGGSRIDTHNDEPVDLSFSPGFTKEFSANSKILANAIGGTSQAGLLALPEGPFMFSAWPVTRSDGSGSVRGVVIFGKYLDQEAQDEYSRILHLPLIIGLATESRFEAFIRTNPREGDQMIEYISANQSIGYTIINDIHDQPTIVIRENLSRDVSRTGNKASLQFILVFLGLSLGGAIISYITFSRIVTRRLLSIVYQLRDYRPNMTGLIIAVSGHDEISQLAHTINQMIDRLRSAHQLEQTNQALEEKVTDRTQELAEQLEQMRRMNNLMVNRELRMKELKDENAELRQQLKQQK